jgi:protein-ribulosamine 3-kinase
MMECIFESEKMIHSFIPENFPAPLVWGSYKSIPNMHFYICAFVEMTDDLPDGAKFGAVLASLHNNSMGKSPKGMYVLPLTTHLAFIPNDNSWASTWTEWFSNAMSRMFEEEERFHGVNDELNVLKAALFDNVIPCLLMPMETGGNSIQPSLCHSDVWPGNMKPDIDTDEVMFFDSCAFWGHHECE